MLFFLICEVHVDVTEKVLTSFSMNKQVDQHNKRVRKVVTCKWLTLFILVTPKWVLLQTVKNKMKCGTSSGSTLFVKVKTILRNRNTS